VAFQGDEIGYWSELKLEILDKYARAYSTILSKQTKPDLYHVYIDGFSGSGFHISKSTGEVVEGSPIRALAVDPPFREYFLVDLAGEKVEALRQTIGNRRDVHVFHGNSNDILLRECFPRVQYKDFRRGLCLLDPYGLHLSWKVIEAAGKMGTLDLFLNFPIHDMNRNALWRDPEGSTAEQRERITFFWGDESWRTDVYKPSKQTSLFGEVELEKQGNPEVAAAFRRRLREVAGFAEVPEPLPMRNTRGAIVYYLFFASQRHVALKIVKEIFAKYRDRTS
jgi:three-Cys-motif partner protein